MRNYSQRFLKDGAKKGRRSARGMAPALQNKKAAGYRSFLMSY
jgi:hypothetical protein